MIYQSSSDTIFLELLNRILMFSLLLICRATWFLREPPSLTSALRRRPAVTGVTGWTPLTSPRWLFQLQPRSVNINRRKNLNCFIWKQSFIVSGKQVFKDYKMCVWNMILLFMNDEFILFPLSRSVTWLSRPLKQLVRSSSCRLI